MNKYFTTGLSAFLLWLAVICLQGMKLSFIYGSWLGFFSFSHVCVPLVGLYTGAGGSVLLLMLRFFLRTTIKPWSFLRICAQILPGFSASLLWASAGHWGIQIVIPVISFLLFIVHPVGMGAWPYALYWLIPIILYVRQSRSLFSRSLASTFVAHGVGSVLWLYMGMLPTAAQWYALIPLVAVERLLFAGLMTGVSICMGYMMRRLAAKKGMISRLNTSTDC